MIVYAICLDGKIYKVSYRQNSPFYDTYIGAQKALQYLINSHISNYVVSKEHPDWEDEVRQHFTIQEFQVVPIDN